MKSNFTTTPATITDAQEITDLIIACDIADYGQPDIVLEDTIEMLTSIPLQTNTWVIRNENQVIAFAFVEDDGNGKLYSSASILPQYRGQGIGNLLIDKIEERARAITMEQPLTSYKLSNVIPAQNPKAHDLLQKRSYQFQRNYWRMGIELTHLPKAPTPIDGINIRVYDEQTDQKALYNAYVESFQDTRSHQAQPFEEWIEFKNASQYDKSLWFVACEGEELIGFIICKNFSDHIYIDLLGVRRNWRKCGIGQNLLELIFREAFNKEIFTVILSVDSTSLTNANKLYEKVGMKVLFQMSYYDKQL